MTALPLQLDAILASASPELRATLALPWENGEKEQKELSGPNAEPLPWPGLVHEIFAAPPDGQIGRFGTHHPIPAAVLIGWAARQLAQSKGRLTVWVGRRAWPYPRVLERAGLLGGSLFVDAADNNQRLWAAELALRSPAVATVIADGSGFGMSATRRLQLIARESETLMLLPRPSRDERQLSASGVRWRVGVVPAAGDAPQWKIQLLRCKGVRPTSLGSHGPSHPAWTLCWDAESASTRVTDRDVDHERDLPGAAPAAAIPGGVSANLARRPSAAPPPPIRRTG